MSEQPSDLYKRIHALARQLARVCGDEDQAGAEGPDVMEMRSKDAKHSWGHAAYVQSRKGLLHEMTNDQFLAYMSGHAGVVQGGTAKVHRILVDEHERTAVLCMSIFLTVQGEDTPLEQDMIWIMETDPEGENITRTVEYVDAVTAKRLAEAFDRAGKTNFGVEGAHRLDYMAQATQ